MRVAEDYIREMWPTTSNVGYRNLPIFRRSFVWEYCQPLVPSISILQQKRRHNVASDDFGESHAVLIDKRFNQNFLLFSLLYGSYGYVYQNVQSQTLRNFLSRTRRYHVSQTPDDQQGIMKKRQQPEPVFQQTYRNFNAFITRVVCRKSHTADSHENLLLDTVFILVEQ